MSDWIQNAENCGIPQFEKCADTMCNWYSGIINSFSTTNDNEVARLKPGEIYVAKLPDRRVVYSVKLKGAFGSAKEMICEPNTNNRFSVGPSQSGMSFVVSKVDMLDGRD